MNCTLDENQELQIKVTLYDTQLNVEYPLSLSLSLSFTHTHTNEKIRTIRSSVIIQHYESLSILKPLKLHY